MRKLNLKEKVRYLSAVVSSKIEIFTSDVRALSGIEFALIAPMLIGVYLGVAETALGVTNSRKVSRVAATLSDLVAQSETITGAQVDGIMNAAKAVMEPYSSDPLKIYVIGVQMDSNGIARVAWSRASSNATPPAVGTIYPIPASIKIANSFLVVTNVTYAFTPAIGGNIISTLNFNEINYNVPRTSTTVGFS